MLFKACLSECDQGGNLSCGLITATPYESTSELSENDLIYNMKDTAVSDLELHKVHIVHVFFHAPNYFSKAYCW